MPPDARLIAIAACMLISLLLTLALPRTARVSQTPLTHPQAALKEVEDKLAELQRVFEETTERKEKLEAQSADCAAKLERAERLIGGLGGEKDRWSAASKQLGVVFDNITGDVLIASGVVSYMGPFTALFRDQQVDEWILKNKEMKVPCSDKFLLTDTLGDAVKIRSWVCLPWISEPPTLLPLHCH